MRLSNVCEAPCIRTNLLLTQANSKKGFKTIQPEINKMSEIFGIEFDKHLYKSLFDEIDFKDLKTLLNNKNSSNKFQYFIQEFPLLLERSDFISIFSQILMNALNISSAQEMFDGLNKITKLTFESQFKIIISFFYCMNDKLTEEAKSILISKCHELHKEGKCEQLTQETVQALLLIISSLDSLQSDSFFTRTFVNFLQMVPSNVSHDDEMKQISEIDAQMEMTGEDPIEFEKILQDLGPMAINNLIYLTRPEIVDSKMDEKRLASFILFLCKHQSWVEDKENRYLNKVFLRSLNHEASSNIDENLEKKVQVNWNLDNFYKIYKVYFDNINMSNLVNLFDDPMFCIKDKKSFEYFMNILNKIKVLNVTSLLYTLIFKKWNNEMNQIEFLSFLINNPLESFSFKNWNGRKVKKQFEFSVSINKSSLAHLIEAWSTIDLIEILLKLSKGNFYVKVKEIFEWPIANVPELLILAFAVIKPDGDDFLYEELINETLPMFFGNHVNGLNVIEGAWGLNKDMVINAICAMYRSNPDVTTLSKILDVTQKIKDSLMALVTCNDLTFAVNLAIHAWKRDLLHFDQWLAERISKIGDNIIECLLNYIKENVIAYTKDAAAFTSQPSVKENVLERSQLSLESLAMIFDNLTPIKIGKNPKVSKTIEQEITNTYKALFEIFDDLQLQPPNSEEIEDTTNKMYQSLFKGESTVDEILDKMKAFKNSQNPRESEIYACFIHSILDEYRFFYQYPEKELAAISTLFGQIINNRLFDGIIETIALKYIQEGIKKASGNMFIFATNALEQFIDKLILWPQYLQSLIEIKALKNVTGLYEKICDKFNEITNKAKKMNDDVLNLHKISSGGINPSVADDEKKVTSVKMPDVPKKEFLEVLKSISSQGGAATSNLPIGVPFNIPQAGGKIKQNLEQTSYIPSIPNQFGGFPDIYMGSSLYFQPEKSSEDFNENKALKDEDKKCSEGDYMAIKSNFPNPSQNLNVSAFNSSDGKSNNTSKTRLAKLPQPSSVLGNITQILGNENESTVQAPRQDVIENINFIFNSMSKSNVNEKSNELKGLLSNESTIRWFSNFFILNRVSAENNNHQIYNELISLIDSKELNQLLIKDTISFIKKLLQSENLAKDLKEKNVLKNLGSWLGIMTLAKNKPVLAKDLDLKEIIFDAYENGKLSAITNFVARILEHSQKTKVFHTKNPWIMAILAVLAELNSKPNLKHNLKFEIDNLFKKLELDLNSYTPSKLLDGLIVCQNSPDFTKPQNELHDDGLNFQEIYSRIMSVDQYVNEVFTAITGKAQSNSQILSKHDLIALLTTVLMGAINEIITPVVERAVNISQMTTRELILKDFAFEKDEAKFKNAASLCIKSLAGSLAMVTCKEPLRVGYTSQLKELLSKKGIEQEIIDTVSNSVNNTELLDIGCYYIQNFVIKRAIEKIQCDKVIIEELEKRRKNKGPEMKNEILTKIKLLPEVLRPNSSGLSFEYYKIYEDFDKISDSMIKIDTQSGIKSNFLKIIFHALTEVLNSYQTISSHNAYKIISKYEICMMNIQNVARSNQDIECCEEESKYMFLSKIIMDSKITDLEIAMELAGITYKYTVTNSNLQNAQLSNVYSELLRGWVKLHPSIAKDITGKVLNSEDILIRFQLDVHLLFFKKNLFDLNDYEHYISDYLDEVSMNKTVRKLLAFLLEKNMISLTTFKKIPSYAIDPLISGNYFDFFARKSTYCSNTPIISLVDFQICTIKDQSNFSRFMDMCKYAHQMINAFYAMQQFDVEKARLKLKYFIESPLMTSEEQLNVFIMIITDLGVKGALIYDPENNIYPETSAKCIMGWMNIVPSSLNKVKIFENILFGIFKIFHADYVKNTWTFNQKPYYKILFSMIYLIYSSDQNDEIFNGGFTKLQYFGTLSDLFRVMSPLNYPGFAFAWIDLISCKYFSNFFLEIETNSKLKDQIPKYEKYMQLVNELLSYLKTFSFDLLADYTSRVFIDTMYKFMYLLSISFPDFFSYYYYTLLAALSPGDSFLQLKNIILHCTPSDIEAPDPFCDDFQVDSSPDINKNSIILFDIASILNEYGFKTLIDDFLDNKNETAFEDLLKKLNNNIKDKDQSNYYIINAIVIFISQVILKANADKKTKNSDILDFLFKLIKSLDAENRDHLINSFLNELRYPSYQTCYFSSLLQKVFYELKSEVIEEHILKNIMQRLLYKPYPWGLLVTFLQITKHPKFEPGKKSYINKSQCEKSIEDLLKFIKATRKTLDQFVM